MHFMAVRERDDGGVDLSVTPINPSVDYERAVCARQPLCLKHVRDGSVTVEKLGELRL